MDQILGPEGTGGKGGGQPDYFSLRSNPAHTWEVKEPAGWSCCYCDGRGTGRKELCVHSRQEMCTQPGEQPTPQRGQTSELPHLRGSTSTQRVPTPRGCHIPGFHTSGMPSTRGMSALKGVHTQFGTEENTSGILTLEGVHTSGDSHSWGIPTPREGSHSSGWGGQLRRAPARSGGMLRDGIPGMAALLIPGGAGLPGAGSLTSSFARRGCISLCCVS